MENKICAKCNCSKPATLEHFPKYYDGLFAWCRECKRNWQSKYNKTDAGKRAQSKYSQTDKGKLNNIKGTTKYVKKTKGVYGIFDNQDNCLYIGASSQFNGRIIAHKHAINNLEQAAKHRKSMLHLYEELSQYDSISFRLLGEFNRDELKEREAEYIAQYQPIYNIYKK